MIAPYAPRTPNLPPKATLAKILVNRWIPHVQGITLADSRYFFADIFRLSEVLGIELGLAREVEGGLPVCRLYSGGPNAVTIGESGNEVIRVIGRTHPGGAALPSGADRRNINAAFLRALEADAYSPVPVRIIIWGAKHGQTTPYYPDVLR